MCWIFNTITCIVHARRSQSKGPPALLGLDLPISVQAELSAERHADLARRLALTPLFVRETYLLRAVDRMSIEEISIRLAISPRRARQYLRQSIICSREETTADAYHSGVSGRGR